MRKLIAAALVAAAFATPALADHIPPSVGGSFDRGHPWYGASHLNRYGVQGSLPEHFGRRFGGYRYGGGQRIAGPVYYRGGGYQRRFGYSVASYWSHRRMSYGTTGIVRYGGTCFRAGVECPCQPRYARHRIYRSAPTRTATRPLCSTCGGSTVVQEQNRVTMGNIAAGATVTINQTGTQTVGGGIGTARAPTSVHTTSVYDATSAMRQKGCIPFETQSGAQRWTCGGKVVAVTQ